MFLNSNLLVLLVLMCNIIKCFGGVIVLVNVDLDVYVGEVLVIVGDNGVGKLMLIKILIGVYQLIDGDVFVGG